MGIPAESDINVYNSLDEIVARDHFLNKTLEEAESLFRENSAYYQEDLMWMGPRAFAFYLQAAANYLKSDHAAGDDQMVDSLYEIILFRRQQEGFALAVERVKNLIDYVIANFAKFDVDPDVYGDLATKYVELRRELEDLQ